MADLMPSCCKINTSRNVSMLMLIRLTLPSAFPKKLTEDSYTKSNTGEQIFTTECLLSSPHVLFPFFFHQIFYIPLCLALSCILVRASMSMALSSLLVSKLLYFLLPRSVMRTCLWGSFQMPTASEVCQLYKADLEN